MMDTRIIDRKEDWLHACAVVAPEKFSGLSSMLFFCYVYEKMMIGELRGCQLPLLPSSVMYKYAAFYRAWIVTFYEVLYIINKYHKEFKAPCLKGKVSEIRKIKKVITRIRSNLSKLEDCDPRPKQERLKEDKNGNMDIKLKISGHHFIGIFRYEKVEKAQEPDETHIDTYYESKKFLLILKNCDVPEYGKHWLSKTVI